MIKFIPTFIAAILLVTAVPTAQASTSSIIRIHSSDLLNQGIQALRQGNMERAITSLERYLKEPVSKRNRVVAHNNLCIAYHYSGDFGAAVEQCSIAIKLDPKYWRAYNNRGNVHLAGGSYDAASADYSLALEINPKAKAVQENLELVRGEAAKR